MVFLYMREPAKDISLVGSSWMFRGSLIVLAILTIYFGIAPGDVTQLLHSYYSGDWMAMLAP